MVLSGRRWRAVTLMEMLVVLFLFSIITTIIVGFYGYAGRTSSRQQALSENYRKMMVVMDRVQTLLEGGQVLYADTNQVMFVPLNTAQPVLQGGWPNFASSAVTLACKVNSKTKGHQLVLVDGGPQFKEQLFTELPNAIISFSLGTNAATSQNFVTITLNGVIAATEDQGQMRGYSFSRQVLLEQF